MVVERKKWRDFYLINRIVDHVHKFERLCQLCDPTESPIAWCCSHPGAGRVAFVSSP
jgi:hypothetical protein